MLHGDVDDAVRRVRVAGVPVDEHSLVPVVRVVREAVVQCRLEGRVRQLGVLPDQCPAPVRRQLVTCGLGRGLRFTDDQGDHTADWVTIRRVQERKLKGFGFLALGTGDASLSRASSLPLPCPRPTGSGRFG